MQLGTCINVFPCRFISKVMLSLQRIFAKKYILPNTRSFFNILLHMLRKSSNPRVVGIFLEIRLLCFVEGHRGTFSLLNIIQSTWSIIHFYIFREHVDVYILPLHVYVIVMRIGLDSFVHVDNPRLEGSRFDFSG